MTRGFQKAMVAGILALAAARADRTQAQDAAATKSGAGIRFTFERVGLEVPRYSLSVEESGSGRYMATEGSAEIDRDFTLTGETTAKLLALARDARIAPEVCATKAKNIADTGAKTLAYIAGGISVACSYNYSDSKDVLELTAMLEAIAETMDEGRKLERLHRFDRLGLDAEMIVFVQEVVAGRALEMGTISECLHSIADDPDVIGRVRTQAAKLLPASPQAARPR